MNTTLSADGHARLFDGGPPLRILRLWGRFDPKHQHVRRRMLAVVAIGWLPLLVLALFALANGQHAVWQAFLQDASVHARALVVAPLLILAEVLCIPRLGALAHQFPLRGIVQPADLPRYEAIAGSVRRLRDSWTVEGLAVVLAYVLAGLIIWNVPASFLPDWHRGSPDAPLGRSLASWWHALVSLPILVILLLGWVWRIFLWALYLSKVARLDLRLVASHPEGAGGLMFCGESLGAFATLGMAIGTIVAATELAHVVAGGTVAPQVLGTTALATVVFVIVLMSLPLLTLVGPLFRTWRRAMDTYGILAQRVGATFEDKWIAPARPIAAEELLTSPDFSAVADLAPSIEKANSMRPLPISMRQVAPLALATALPFGIVVAAMMPVDKLLSKLLGMFL